MSLRVNSAGFFRVPRDWSLTPERTRKWVDFDLWYLVQGRGEMMHGDRTIALLPGSCLIMRGGEDYTFRPEANHPFQHYFAHFDYLTENGNPIPIERAPAPALYRLVDTPRLIEMLLDRMVQSTGIPGKQPEVWLQAVLAEIRCFDEEQASCRGQTSPIAAWIDELCEQIEHEPERDWAVSDMAMECGMGRSQFYKLFKRQTGHAPQQFVIQERMRLARTLLHESANPIGWIAAKLGYGDVYFFSRQFKVFHGQSPSAFRQSHGEAKY